MEIWSWLCIWYLSLKVKSGWRMHPPLETPCTICLKASCCFAWSICCFVKAALWLAVASSANLLLSACAHCNDLLVMLAVDVLRLVQLQVEDWFLDFVFLWMINISRLVVLTPSMYLGLFWHALVKVLVAGGALLIEVPLEAFVCRGLTMVGANVGDTKPTTKIKRS